MNKILPFALLLFSLAASAGERAMASAPTTAGNKDDYFAIVGNEKISMQEFEAAYHAGVRQRFYHGKIPEKQLKEFRAEVSQTLVDRVLLLQEAKRLGLAADQAEVSAQLAAYEKKYAGNAQWKAHKQDALKGLRAALEEEGMLKAYEQKMRAVNEPGDRMVQAYYDAHHDLFTTPEQSRLSVILLKVAPSSSGDVWRAAFDEAVQLKERLAKGARFSDLAKIHSGDKTASSGGDMGYVHQGMLAAPAQEAVDKLKASEVSEPVTLLSGIALFKLDEHVAAKLNLYADVKERAKKLLQREQSEQAWLAAKEQLRSRVKVSINSAAL